MFTSLHLEEVRQADEDPDNFWVPDYGPDEAGLTVFYACGRWFAVWRSLEEPAEASEEMRWTVPRITSNVDHGDLTFSEV